MGGLGSGLLGRSPRAAGPKESRADPSPTRPGTSPLPHLSQSARGARLSCGHPRPASWRRRRQRQEGEDGGGRGRQRRGHCYSGTKTRSAGTPGAAERTRLPRRHVGSGQLPAGPAPERRGAGPEEQVLGAGAGVRIASEYPVARPERLRSDRPRRLPFPFPILIKVVKVKAANKRRRKVN